MGISPSPSKKHHTTSTDLPQGSTSIEAKKAHPDLLTPSKHPNSNTMPDEDSSSELSSDLEIHHTPTAQSRLRSLLYAGSNSPSSRLSPSSKLPGNHVKKSAMVDEAPEELLSTHHGQMPSSFANLLALHNALEKALLLHLATQGASAAMTIVNSSQSTCSPKRNNSRPPARDERMKTPEPDQQGSSRRDLNTEQEEDMVKTFRLESLVSWPVIKPIVERGSGKNFGEKELAQLLWLWQNDPDGDPIEKEKIKVGKRKDCGSTDVDTQHDHEGGAKEQVGMGFIISRVRSLDPTGSLEKKRLRYTYGLGLEIKARENRQMPSYSLESPGKTNEFLESPSRTCTRGAENRPRKSPSKIKAKDVMNLVALWSSKSVDRKAEVARRLRSYWLHNSLDSSPQTCYITVPSPSRLQRICIPLATLPTLEQTTLAQPTHFFHSHPSPTSTSNPRADLKRHRLDLTRNFPSSPKRKKLDPHPLISPSHSGAANPSLSNLGPGTVQHRALSLLERIKAKEEKQATLLQQQQS